ncbi:MAG: hypothetical protein WDW38_000805 [Sanguina aurantia]
MPSSPAPMSASAPVAPAGPAPVLQAAPSVLAPAAAYEFLATLGAAKAKLSFQKTLFMGILAGVYVGFGALFAITVCGNIPGVVASNPGLAKLLFGMVFPVGLVITLCCGAELFTGNTMMVTAAVIEKRTSFGSLVRNWSASYLGNLIGSILIAVVVAGTGLLATNAMPTAMAVAKTSLPFSQAFIRGVLCNYLVCCAVWLASSSSTMSGKIMGAFLPVMAFATIGLEHSVANMFFLSIGILNGAPVTAMQALTCNLLPVTLGNIVGGAICMASVYGWVFGALGKPAPVVAKA